MRVFKLHGMQGVRVFKRSVVDGAMFDHPYIVAEPTSRGRPQQRIRLFYRGRGVAEYYVSLEAAPRTIVALMRNNFQPL